MAGGRRLLPLFVSRCIVNESALPISSRHLSRYASSAATTFTTGFTDCVAARTLQLRPNLKQVTPACETNWLRRTGFLRRLFGDGRFDVHLEWFPGASLPTGLCQPRRPRSIIPCPFEGGPLTVQIRPHDTTRLEAACGGTVHAPRRNGECDHRCDWHPARR